MGSKESVVHGRQDAEDFVKEYSQVLLGVLDRLYTDIEAEFLALAIETFQTFSFLLLTTAFFLHPALVDDFLQLLALLIFYHIIELDFLILSVALHLLHQLLFDLSV